MDMHHLEPFIGEWKLEASFPGSPPGRAAFEWMLDGRFLVQRSEAPDPAPDSLCVFSADGNAITGTWEICHDGSTWERDFDLNYTRLGG